MAPSVKEILVKWGIDNSNWKSAIQELGKLLDQQAKKNQQAQDAAKKALDDQKAKVAQLAAAHQSVTQQNKLQLQALQLQNAQYRIAQAQVSAQLIQQKLITGQLNQQAAALRLQAAQRKAAQPSAGTGGGRGGGGSSRAGGGGEGFLGGFLGGFSSRLAGTIGFSVLSAEGIGRIFEELSVKVKEFILSTGPLKQVQEQFQKLAVTAGINPTKFIEALRGATKGLVSDTLLYRNANLILQSGVKASQEQIIQLTQATVGLARAQGKDASQAVESLNRFFLTGYARTLAWTTGIQRGQLQVTNLGRNIDQTTRSSLAFKQAFDVITKQYAAIGEPQITYVERLKQVEVAQNRFAEELALTAEKSAGFKVLLDFMGEIVDKINSATESIPKWGDAFGIVGAIIANIFRVVSSVLENAVLQWKAIVGIIKDTALSFGASGGAVGSFTDRLTTLRGVLGTFNEVLIIINAGVKELGNLITFAGETAIPQLKLQLLDMASMLPGIGLLTDALFSKSKEEAAKKIAAASSAFKNRQKNIGDEMFDKLYVADKLTTGQKAPQDYGLTFTAPDQSETQQQELQHSQQMAKLMENLAVQRSKFELEETQTRIKKEEDLDQEQYDRGLLSITDFLQKKKELIDEDFAARKTQLEKQTAAEKEAQEKQNAITKLAASLKKDQAEETYQSQISSLNKQLSDQMKDIEDRRKLKPGDSNKISDADASTARIKLLNQFALFSQSAKNIKDESIRIASMEMEQYYTQQKVDDEKSANEAEKQGQEKTQKLHALTLEQIKDQEAADRKRAETSLAIQRGNITDEQELVSNSFEQLSLSADDYFAKRVNLMKELYDNEVATAQLEYDEGVKTAAALATLDAKKAEAQIKLEKDTTKLILGEQKERLKNAQQVFDDEEKLLSGKLSIAENLDKNSGGGSSNQVPVLESLIHLEKERQTALVENLKYIVAGTQSWYDTAEAIQKSQLALQKYNQELLQAEDLTSTLGKLSSKFGGFFSGIEGLTKDISSVFSAVGNKLSEFSAQKVAEANIRSTQKQGDFSGGILGGIKRFIGVGPQESDSTMVPVAAPGAMADFLAAVGETTKTLNSPTQGKSLSDQVVAFSTSLGNAVGIVGGFSNAISGKGGMASAVSGGISGGLGLGSEVSGLMTAFGASASTAGPAGAIVGGVAAGIGSIMGIFSAKAQQQAQKIANQLIAAFNAVGEEIKAGTQTLTGGIQAEQQLIQQSVSQLSGMKGGRSQLENILPQMEQQLIALQQQQQQVISSFDNNLSVLNTSVNGQSPYKDLLDQINQIISTYTQYIQAGGNVANANQFLQQSFANLAQNGVETLNQDEQTAINNALNYNNLLIQRQQLIQSTNEQLQNIMSQGVAVRQLPEGVTKAQQIESLMFNANEQMDQLNQQIAVSQYQLQVQQQIFGLATTRIGLETQLVALQNAQTDQQTQQILALQNVVSSVSQAVPTSLQATLNELGLGGAFVNPTSEAGLMPQPPVKTGIASVDEQNQLQYQQQLAYYNSLTNPTISYLTPGTAGTAGQLIPSQYGTSTDTYSGIQGVLQALSGTSVGSTVTGLPTTTSTFSAPAGSSLGSTLSNAVTSLSTAVNSLLTIFTGPGGTQSVGLAGVNAGDVSAANTAMAGLSGGGVPQANAIESSIAALTSSDQQSATIWNQKLSISQQISSISSQMVTSESQLISQWMQMIQADMARLQAWTAAFNNTSSSPTAEDSLLNTYMTRARQGFGGFYGETSNPVAG